jgi:hypothetical protein
MTADDMSAKQAVELLLELRAATTWIEVDLQAHEAKRRRIWRLRWTRAAREWRAEYGRLLRAAAETGRRYDELLRSLGVDPEHGYKVLNERERMRREREWYGEHIG